MDKTKLKAYERLKELRSEADRITYAWEETEKLQEWKLGVESALEKLSARDPHGSSQGYREEERSGRGCKGGDIWTAARPRERAETRSFAVCIHNGEYAGTLDLRKVYEVLEDAAAETRNSLRVIDESGHDYLYPNAWFVPIVVPETAEQRLHELAISSRIAVVSCRPRGCGVVAVPAPLRGAHSWGTRSRGRSLRFAPLANVLHPFGVSVRCT